jgi:DNA-binding transcriptional regulator LsrR (DeoR family)
LEVARHLGNLMKSDPETPQLRLVIISSACPATCPEYSSTAFLNLFPSSAVQERIGLFAEPIVAANTFARLATRPGVREAFEAKSKIDVVITSMGDAEDEHDLLTRLMKQAEEDMRALKRHRWVGNVMYRPYNDNGPIHEQDREQRAVTLFELEDFVQMSHTRNKHVILLARACGMCGKTKARSLRPLLANEKLRVWSQIVMDVKSANDLTGSPQP